MRRHSGNNPNLLGLDREHARFLGCSPAASRRISCGSLFKPNEALGRSRASLLTGSRIFGRDDSEEEFRKSNKKLESSDALIAKKLPIINPLVRLPAWPSKLTIQFYTKFIAYTRMKMNQFIFMSFHLFNFIRRC